jgi:hypothetical protein
MLLISLVFSLMPLVDPAVPAMQAPPKMDCSAAEFHQFDFWLGSWNVTAQGKPAGTSRIESAMKGCAIIEHWTSAAGGHGTSLNFYDRRTKAWSQAWIDESGNALHLRGGLVDGRMILQSQPQETPKGPTVQRITWSREPNDAVRQLWESSTDGGRTWTTSFDGLYVHPR